MQMVEMRNRLGIAVAADVERDQTWIRSAQTSAVKAKPRHRAWREVLHEHIGPGNEAFQHRRVGCLSQVQTHRFLAPVQPDEIGTLPRRRRVVATRKIPLRALHLDDTRPGLAQSRGTVRRSDRLFDGHHEHPVERVGERVSRATHRR